MGHVTWGRTLSLTALLAALSGHATLAAQPVDRWPDPGRSAFWWIGGAAVVMAAAFDQATEQASIAHRSSTLGAVARAGNDLGSGRYLLPALGVSYLGGRLLQQPRFAEGVLHTAAAYALGNLVASVGKPLLGRHRPDTLGSPWRFHPLAREGAWHALPSAHTLHAFTIAGAVAEEARKPWVTAAAYGAATLVGWSRVYADEHWASDVALSAVAGAAIGHLSVRLLHGPRRRGPAQRATTPRLPEAHP
jgi:membrane-associated phospholipid phosphatase